MNFPSVQSVRWQHTLSGWNLKPWASDTKTICLWELHGELLSFQFNKMPLFFNAMWGKFPLFTVSCRRETWVKREYVTCNNAQKLQSNRALCTYIPGVMCCNQSAGPSWCSSVLAFTNCLYSPENWMQMWQYITHNTFFNIISDTHVKLKCFTTMWWGQLDCG